MIRTRTRRNTPTRPRGSVYHPNPLCTKTTHDRHSGKPPVTLDSRPRLAPHATAPPRPASRFSGQCRPARMGIVRRCLFHHVGHFNRAHPVTASAILDWGLILLGTRAPTGSTNELRQQSEASHAVAPSGICHWALIDDIACATLADVTGLVRHRSTFPRVGPPTLLISCEVRV